MKKNIAIGLCICVLSTTAVSASTSALTVTAPTPTQAPVSLKGVTISNIQVSNPSAENMEAALKIVKSKINIPSNYSVFDYNIVNQGDFTGYNFYWRTAPTEQTEASMSVTIYGDLITQYQNNEGSMRDYVAHFPKIDAKAAMTVGNTWIKSINPAVASQLEILTPNGTNAYSNISYNFEVGYKKDGITVEGLGGNIQINSETGKVDSYYLNWQNIQSYSDATKAISLDAAKKAYGTEIGIKKVYMPIYKDNEITGTTLAYVPVKSGYTIDALTGKSYLNTGYPIYLTSGKYDGMVRAESSAKSMAGSASNIIVLTPEEQAKLSSLGKLIKVEAAEKIVKEAKHINLDGYINQGATLNKDYSGKDTYTWNFSYFKDETVPTEQVASENTPTRDMGYVNQKFANITVSANTGEIMNYYSSGSYRQNPELQTSTYETYKAQAQTIFKDFAGNKSSEFKLIPDESNRYKDYSVNYYNFVRVVNGVEFPTDTYSVCIDSDGAFTSYSGSYHNNLNFVPATSKLTDAQALAKVFENTTLKKVYTVVYEQQAMADTSMSTKIMPRPMPNNNTGKLVYRLDNPSFTMNADTGKFIDYNGEEIKQEGFGAYTDIAGHKYEAQFKKLGDAGVYLDSTKLNPDANITQLEFLKLAYAAFQGYPYYTKSDEDLKYFYDYLVRNRIVAKNDINPNATLSRAQLTDIFAGFMKIREYTDLLAFAMPYNDVAKNLGTVAILNALGVFDIEGKSFNPSQVVTKAEAMHYLFNYMSREME